MDKELRLRITTGSLAEMHRLAASVPNTEIIGLLAAAKDDPRFVTSICLLPAVATGGSATASGAAIRAAMARLGSLGMVSAGVFHSHARFSVFHSATDDRMIERLFSTLAGACMATLAEAFEPQLTDQDRALLPLRDGRMLKVGIRGESIGGGFDRLAWESARLTFRSDAEPGVRYVHPIVELFGQRSTLELQVPDALTVEITQIEAPHRAATLHSVVVNAKGDITVEAVTVLDINGRIFQERQAVDVETVNSSVSRLEPNLHFYLYREEQTLTVAGEIQSAMLSETWKANGHKS